MQSKNSVALHKSRALLTSMCVLLLTGFSLDAFASTYPVGPRGHYLHAKASDTVTSPTVIDLSTEGISPGDTIELEQLGGVVGVGGGGDDQTSMSAVFSSSSTVTAIANSHRVPGAIACPTCTAIITAPTCAGSPNETTDISEDFFISGPGGTNSPAQTVTVPTGAAYLIVGVPDCKSSDNSDPNGDSMVRIDELGAEPGQVPSVSNKGLLIISLLLVTIALVVTRRQLATESHV
jgi:hypothetical protein